MRIIAVDDEALQLETIVEYLYELYPYSEIKGFTKVSEVLDFFENNTADIAILDINMSGTVSGINLGEILRQKNKRIKLLFCTGYSEYAMEAFKIHANGYLQKPIRKQDLMKEMQYIINMPVFDSDEKPYIHTFGNFDVFIKNRPIIFKRKKSKEILAYIVDREGAWVTNKELTVALWDETGRDASFSKYVTTLLAEMVTALQNAGIGHIIERHRGNIRLLKTEVDCDYYEFLKGSEKGKSGFHGEYMSQYSWAESTLSSILQK